MHNTATISTLFNLPYLQWPRSFLRHSRPPVVIIQLTTHHTDVSMFCVVDCLIYRLNPHFRRYQFKLAFVRVRYFIGEVRLLDWAPDCCGRYPVAYPLCSLRRRLVFRYWFCKNRPYFKLSQLLPYTSSITHAYNTLVHYIVKVHLFTQQELIYPKRNLPSVPDQLALNIS